MGKLHTVRDPQRFLVELPDSKDHLALSLDLGTMTGYAAAYFNPRNFDPAELEIWAGQLDLSLGPYDSRGLSAVRLVAYLRRARPDLLFMEDVKYTPPQMPGVKISAAALLARAATSLEFFGGLKMQVTAFAEECDIPLYAVPIKTIKKRATGSGNAKKDQVITAANKEFGLSLPLTEAEKSSGADNVADAIWALVAGMEEYAHGVIPLVPERSRVCQVSNPVLPAPEPPPSDQAPSATTHSQRRNPPRPTARIVSAAERPPATKRPSAARPPLLRPTPRAASTTSTAAKPSSPSRPVR